MEDSIMMRIFDYCFYHVIRVNTDEVNPPVLAYIAGITAAGLPMFFIVMTLLIWFSIIPKDIGFEDFEKYYSFVSFAILVVIIPRYGPKRYEKLVQKWQDKALSVKSKVLGLVFIFSSIIIGFLTMWFRFN